MKRKSIRRLGVILAASTLVAQMGLAGVTAVSATEQPTEVTEQQLATFAEENDKLVGELDDALSEQGVVVEELISEKENVGNQGIMDLNSSEVPVQEDEESSTLFGTYADGGEWSFSKESGILTLVGGTVETIEGVSPWIDQGLQKDEIKEVIFETFEPIRGGETLSGLFKNHSNLSNIEFNNFDTSYVTTMYQMFYSAKAIGKLDLSKFNTQNVMNMVSMFNNTSELSQVDLSTFDTRKVESMGSMFDGTVKLSELDLSAFDTQNVMSMTGMFKDSGINKLILGNAFEFKGNFDYIYFPNAPYQTKWHQKESSWNNYYGINLMNYHNNLIASSTLRSFEYLAVYNDEWNQGTYADDGKWSFEESSGTLTLIGGILETTDQKAPWIAQGLQKEKILKVIFSTEEKIRSGKDIECLFYEYSMLAEIQFNQFDTSEAMYWDSIFYGTTSLEQVDISKFVTSRAITMNAMFAYSGVKELDLSNFDTSQVSYMKGMFGKTASLKKLNLSSFNTQNLEHMELIFNETPELGTLILGESFVFVDLEHSSLTDPLSTQIWIHVENQNWSADTSLELMNYHNDQVKNYEGEMKVFTYEKVLRDGGEEVTEAYELIIPAILVLNEAGGELPIGVDINIEQHVYVGLSGNEDNQLILKNDFLKNTYYHSRITHNGKEIANDFGMEFWVSGIKTLEFSAPELVGDELFYNLEFTAPLTFTASLIQD